MQRRLFVFSGFATIAFISNPALAETHLRVGVTAGPAAEILRQVVPIAKEKGLNIEIREFHDYVRPHAALADGSLDANVFSTQAWTDLQNHERGYDLVSVGKAFTTPMAFYSLNYKSFDEVPSGSVVGIPEDQAMAARALRLLAANNIIELKDGAGATPSMADIVRNPRKLKFKRIDAAALSDALQDLPVLAINGNFAAVAGLNSVKDGLITEDKDSTYVCNVVVSRENSRAAWIKPFVEAVQDHRISEFINSRTEGTVIPALLPAPVKQREIGKKVNKTIYLAGGCFWGVQKYFDLIKGVVSTEVGYANGPTENPTYRDVVAHSGHAETVRITYDPAKLPLRRLLDYYFDVIDPFSLNKQGHDRGIQYRTGIYYTDEDDKKIAESALKELSEKLGRQVVVQCLPLENFYPAEEYHQKYLDKNPGGYCHINLSKFRDLQ